MKVIVPCGGSSSRYPGVAPKWMLPASDGRPMISHAVEKLQFELGDLIIAVLKEHDERFSAVQGLRNFFGHAVTIVTLDKATRSQPETVSNTLLLTGINEPFLVKDCDSSFVLQDIEQPFNYVSGASLNGFDQINPRNKSYMQVDESDVLRGIREKEVISDLFSVGGYYFRNPRQYVEAFDRLCAEQEVWQRELYTSDIISTLIMDGEPFKVRRVLDYQDWGTLVEWKRTLQTRGVYFIQLDGFVFERGSAFFPPRFEEVSANPQAVEVVKDLIKAGNKLIFVSIRPEAVRELTFAQMASVGLPSEDVIFDMPIGRYNLITAPHPSVPFLSAHALEIDPTDPSLSAKVKQGY
jgi:NDP-sugar pyrophosphorylase family protein